MSNYRLKIFCALFSELALSGCLYTTHHFNSGVIMPAGESQATLGAGRQPLWRCDHPSSDSTISDHACNEDGKGTEVVSQSGIFKGSVDYRLGIRNQWG